MVINLQFMQMKMAFNVAVKTPSNFQALQHLAFDKAWECVSDYFKAEGKPLPKHRHGSPSYTHITSDSIEVNSDAAFKLCLKKGIKTFEVTFKVISHPLIPLVSFHG